jgi:hypothetical protein
VIVDAGSADVPSASREGAAVVPNPNGKALKAPFALRDECGRAVRAPSQEQALDCWNMGKPGSKR